MNILTSFWRAAAVWTAVIALILIAITLLTGGGTDALTSVPVWAGAAFMLSAYPAGISVSEAVVPGPGLSASRIALFVATSVTASVAAFALANWVAPALIAGGAAGPFPDPSGMTLGELRSQLDSLGRQAASGPESAASWLPFNHLAYHYVRRTDGTLLPALFAWVGLFCGYWGGRIPRAEPRILMLWGMGAFLMVSTYLAGENGYEMILTRIGGPAEFVGDLVLIVPGTLAIGMGVATVVSLYTSPAGLLEDRTVE